MLSLTACPDRTDQSHPHHRVSQMPLRVGDQASRPLSLLVLVLVLLPSVALLSVTTAAYPSIQRLSIVAMAASTKPITVVSGANKGIGYEIMKKLAPASSIAVLAARNPQLGEAAAKQLREKEGLSNVVFKPLDLNSPESIRAFASSMEKDYGRVDTLVNNAGFAFKGKDPTPFREQAGPTLRTNFYGTVALIDAMVPLLRKSADPRIVNVASQSGARLAILDTDKAKQREVSSPDLTRARLLKMVRQFEADVQAGTHAAQGWPSTTYGMSKLALIAFGRVFAAEEARAHGGAGDKKPIWLASCCPGWCATDMSSHSGPRSAEHGARTPAWLALRGKEEGARSGGFFYDEREIAW